MKPMISILLWMVAGLLYAGGLNVGTRFTIGTCHQSRQCISHYAHEASLSWPSIEVVEAEISAEFHSWMGQNFPHWQFTNLLTDNRSVDALLEASVEDEIQGSGRTLLIVRLSAVFLQNPVEIGRTVIYDEHHFKATVLQSADFETDVLKQALGRIFNTTRRQQIEDQVKLVLPVAFRPQFDEQGNRLIIPLYKEAHSHLSHATFRMISQEDQILFGKSRGDWDVYRSETSAADDALVLFPQKLGNQLFLDLSEGDRQRLKLLPVVFLENYSQFNFDAFASFEP